MKYTDTSLLNDATLEGELPASSRRRRERPGDRVLSTDAEAWLADLPIAIRPVQLPKSFPRICNDLVERWPEPKYVIPFLDDLLVDRRDGRQGFQLSIIMEVSELKRYFMEMYAPSKLDIWGGTPGLY